MAAASRRNQVGQGILERIEPAFLAAGYELVLCEYLRGSQVLRLFIDRAPNAGAPVVPEPVGTLYRSGITLEDCQACTSIAENVLADESSLPPLGEYSLEVSSPGIERPLQTPRDFARFVGHKAHIKLRRPAALAAGTRVYEASLAEVRPDGVLLDLEAGPVCIAFSDIERARLIAEWP